MSSIEMEMRNLQSIDYVMCEHDVYCGRGNQCYHYVGNQKFRKIILENLNRYSVTTHKYDKSSIINEIINQVREKSRQYNGLGFVRKDNKTGRLYEVSNSVAVSMNYFSTNIRQMTKLKGFILPKCLIF